MSTKRRAYLTEMKTQLALAVPALLAQIAMISMGFVDMVMTGRVGAVDMAAVALAGSLWVPLVLFGQGLLLAVTPCVAQLRGAGSMRSGEHMQGVGHIMLADRQTTGGYTKIANVITVDLPRITQSKPGDIIRFEAVSIEAAQELYLAQRARFEELRRSFEEKRGDSRAPVAPGIALAALGLSGGEERIFHVGLDGHDYRCVVREIKR